MARLTIVFGVELLPSFSSPGRYHILVDGATDFHNKFFQTEVESRYNFEPSISIRICMIRQKGQ